MVSWWRIGGGLSGLRSFSHLSLCRLEFSGAGTLALINDTLLRTHNYSALFHLILKRNRILWSQRSLWDGSIVLGVYSTLLS